MGLNRLNQQEVAMSAQSPLTSPRKDRLRYTVSVDESFLKPTPLDEFIEFSGEVRQDIVLQPGFYQVTQNDLIVRPNMTLTLLPGVVMEFAADRKLVIHGHLIAPDNESIPVFLRGRNGARWGGIEVYSEFWEPRASALLRHTTIKHAQEALNVGPRASVTLEENCLLTENVMLSRYVLGHFVIQDSEAANNARGWVVYSIGVNPNDPDRVGHLELSRNIIREVPYPFCQNGFGQLTLKNNVHIRHITG